MQAGVIIAWRAWRLGWRDDYLISRFWDLRWLPAQPMIAVPKPALTNASGFRAYKSRADLLESIEFKGRGPEYVVLGRVSLWGTAIKHERGYRAEFANPDCLCYFNDSELVQRIQSCARYYGVEALPIEIVDKP